MNRLIKIIIITVIFNIFMTNVTWSNEHPFNAYTLKIDGRLIDYVIEDMNNDGLNDCLFFYLKETPESTYRHFAVFYQNKNGFNDTADQSFEVDQEAIIFDIADVDKAKGKEILIFTGTGLLYYKQDLGRYLETPRKLLKADSIFTLVDKKSLEYLDFSRDLNNDGTDEILIPRFYDYLLYRQDKSGNYIFNTKLNIQIQTNIVSSKEVSRYLVSSFIIPNILVSDYNKDQRDDIIVIQDTFLKVFFQNEQGSFYNNNAINVDLGFEITQAYSLTFLDNRHGQREWMKEKTGVKCIQDINKDGLMDIVIEKFSLKEGAFNQKKEYEIFFGKDSSEGSSKGGIFHKIPDHIFSSPKYQAECVLVDVNKDQKLDAIVPVIEMGFFKIISMLISGKIDVTANIFLMNNTHTYSKTPDDTFSFSMKVDRTGKIIPVISYSGDYNGDGRRDFLTNDENNLVIYLGAEKNYIRNKPSIVYPVEIPDNGTKVKPFNINADTKSDIIIIYPATQDGDASVESKACILMSI